ncbi:MAG: DUF2752 domain-containing protein [Bacteroidales bacterium]|nr:DUF2752 domain-containing protein [Bacteroidales bacterium]MDD3892291.1 DUF2752 domain-containing protein [Bacteroidales bacterium]
MSLSRNKLYTLLFISCMVGYVWLYMGIKTNITEKKPVEVCLVKHITNIPCPSCGTTRSVISLAKGKFKDALQINPLGYVVATIMILAPIWILIDILIKKETLFGFYQKMEKYLKKPQFAFPLIVLVIINWIWNITKGL